MIKNVISVLTLMLVLLSCSQNKYFQFENNGGGMPHSASYKITLSKDTLFLLGIEKLEFSGDYYIILDKKEKKEWLDRINQLELETLQSSKGGAQYFYYYKDKKQEYKKQVGGLIPKKCKMFSSYVEEKINQKKWIKNE